MELGLSERPGVKLCGLSYASRVRGQSRGRFPYTKDLRFRGDHRTALQVRPRARDWRSTVAVSAAETGLQPFLSVPFPSSPAARRYSRWLGEFFRSCPPRFPFFPFQTHAPPPFDSSHPHAHAQTHTHTHTHTTTTTTRFLTPASHPPSPSIVLLAKLYDLAFGSSSSSSSSSSSHAPSSPSTSSLSSLLGSYYIYLLPLTLIPAFFTIYFNWLSLKVYRHN